jgi:hypothetical protein
MYVNEGTVEIRVTHQVPQDMSIHTCLGQVGPVSVPQLVRIARQYVGLLPVVAE